MGTVRYIQVQGTLLTDTRTRQTQQSSRKFWQNAWVEMQKPRNLCACVSTDLVRDSDGLVSLL